VKVCLVSVEYFAWGINAGFGMFTRKLGTELVKHGVEVEAFITTADYSKRVPVGEYEDIDGVKVKTLPRLKHKLFKGKVYKTDADIIHSESSPFDTSLTFRNNPILPKLITVQDLRSYKERKWLYGLGGEPHSIEWSVPKGSHVPISWLTWHTAKVNIHTADCVACQAYLLKEKIKDVFHYSKPTSYLPNFIDVPPFPSVKFNRPSVVWLGRLDHVKRPELMFELAKLAPDIDFYVLGKSHFKERGLKYTEKYGNNKVPNIFLMGHLEGKEKEEILNKSWILLNTSFYECLPVSFLEALAHGCALLSTRNPDGYTNSFGYYSSDDTASGLLWGLRWLLSGDRWAFKGKAGYDFVKQHHNTELEVDRHIQLYKRLIEWKN
jgi:glycosyltransferase involved in cell wall biosynthesis